MAVKDGAFPGEIQSRTGPGLWTGTCLGKHHDGRPGGDCCGSTRREMAGRLEGHVQSSLVVKKIIR